MGDLAEVLAAWDDAAARLSAQVARELPRIYRPSSDRLEPQAKAVEAALAAITDRPAVLLSEIARLRREGVSLDAAVREAFPS